MPRRRIIIRADDLEPEQLEQALRNALDACEPYRGQMVIDHEASANTGGGVVMSLRDADGNFVSVEFNSMDEAIDFAAEVNHTTREELEEQLRLQAEYVGEIRTGKKRSA